MTIEYNLLRDVYLTSETLLNIAVFDGTDEKLMQKLDDYKSHKNYNLKDLIPTMKFINSNGYIEHEDVIRLIENKNLSAHELFHIMILNIEGSRSYGRRDEINKKNQMICDVGSSNPVFDKSKYTDFLIQVLDIYPVEVSVSPLSPKNILYRVLKNKSPNFVAMEFICNNPNTDKELLSHTAKEFYQIFEGLHISSFEEQAELVEKVLREKNPNMSDENIKAVSIMINTVRTAKINGCFVHTNLRQIDAKMAKYWQEYYNVSAFDD